MKKTTYRCSVDNASGDRTDILNINKGNNKITEHRAIFQREIQNS